MFTARSPVHGLQFLQMINNDCLAMNNMLRKPHALVHDLASRTHYGKDRSIAAVSPLSLASGAAQFQQMEMNNMSVSLPLLATF